jgi:hypothetical protein
MLLLLKETGSKMLTRQIAQRSSSRISFEGEYVVPIKHLEITFSDKPVLTFPIISPRASSSCPKPIIYINRNWDNPKDSKGIDVVITS